MMNSKARAEFDRVTAIDPKELTKDDVAFLKARRAYLRPEQKQVFSDVLKGEKEMTKEQKAVFEKENQKAVLKAKKEAEEKAKADKTVQESQNPEGN